MVESAKTGRGGFSAELQQSALSVEQCLGILTDPTLLNLCHHPYKSANRPHFLALSKSTPAYSPRFTSPKRRSGRPPLIIHTTPSSPAYSEKPAPFSMRTASSCRPSSHRPVNQAGLVSRQSRQVLAAARQFGNKPPQPRPLSLAHPRPFQIPQHHKISETTRPRLKSRELLSFNTSDRIQAALSVMVP